MKKRNTTGKLGVSRRDFLRNAGAGLMAAELAGASPGKPQTPALPTPACAFHAAGRADADLSQPLRAARHLQRLCSQGREPRHLD